MNTAETIVRLVGATGAASAATATGLLAYPGDLVPQVIIIGFASVATFAGAFVAFWKGSA